MPVETSHNYLECCTDSLTTANTFCNCWQASWSHACEVMTLYACMQDRGDKYTCTYTNLSYAHVYTLWTCTSLLDPQVGVTQVESTLVLCIYLMDVEILVSTHTHTHTDEPQLPRMQTAIYHTGLDVKSESHPHTHMYTYIHVCTHTLTPNSLPFLLPCHHW